MTIRVPRNLRKLSAAVALSIAGCSSLQVEALNTTNQDKLLEQTPANPQHFSISPSPQSLLSGTTEPAIPEEPRTVATEPPAASDYLSISLHEAIHTALQNSTVLRDLGGRILEVPQATASRFQVALQDTDPRFGLQTALSEFDAELSATGMFEKNHRPLNNIFLGGGTRELRQDFNDYTVELSKPTAAGTSFSLRSLTDYDANNAPGNQFPSVWQTRVEAEMRQPLLRGAGTNVNRVIGRRDNLALANGIAVARIRSNISQVDFELGIRDFVSDVVNAYWDLYYAYRILDTTVEARDRALAAWRAAKQQQAAGRAGTESEKEYMLLTEYYRLESEVQNALSGRQQEGTASRSGSSGGTFRGNAGVYLAERRLRRILGMPITDDKVIRPSDEPTVAEINLDWHSSALEALYRRPELKKERLRNKQLGMIVSASKNYLLPQLDAVGRYRWRGMGSDLFPQGDRNRFNDDGSENQFQSAVGNMVDGDFQEWYLGVEFSVPIGYRRANAAVHHAELQLARQRAILREQEQQVLLDLSNAVGEMRRAYAVLQNNYNQVVAAQELLDAIEANRSRSKGVQFDLSKLSDAQNRVMSAQNLYHYSIVEYAIAIKNVHFEKGSLPDYFDVMVTDTTEEKPLPGVAATAPSEREGWRKLTDRNRLLLKQQLSQYPGFTPELESELVALLDGAQFDELSDRLAELISEGRNSSEAQLNHASLMLNAELYNAARHFARSAKSTSPADAADAERFLGHIDVIEGVLTANHELIAKGRDRYLQLLNQDPLDGASANNAIWITQSQLHDPGQALVIAERVRETMPLERMPQQLIRTLSDLYLSMSRPSVSRTLLTTAIELHPENASFRYRLAELLAASDEPSAALRTLAAALQHSQVDELNGDLTAMLDNVSRQLCRKQHPPETALRLARACLASQLLHSAELWALNAKQGAQPSDQPAIDHLLGDIALVDGLARQDEERLQAAAGWYRAVLEQDKQNWVAANNLVSLYSRHLDQPQAAVASIEQILSRSSVSKLPVKLVETMAVSYRHAEQTHRAIELLEKAVNERPEVPEFHFQLALTHFATGNRGQAQVAYDESIRLGLPPQRVSALKANPSQAPDTGIRKVSAQPGAAGPR